MTLTWILERDVFPDNHDRLSKAVQDMGQHVITWNDNWWETSKITRYNDQPVIFHGSLGNAARLKKETPWRPGAFCNIKAFECTSWYPNAASWIVNGRWCLSTIRDFIENPKDILQKIGGAASFFVRPNSPLKPFSGRTLNLESLSLKALDHGFYYDDDRLEIIVAPVQCILDEWRYIIVNGKVVTGSGYCAETRTEHIVNSDTDSWEFAQSVAEQLIPPETVYVMDICRLEDSYKLLELNPFSGADLYGCDRRSIVKSVTSLYESGF